MPRPSSSRGDLGAYLVLSVGGLVMIAPFLYQLSASLMTNAEVLSVPKALLPSQAVWGNYPDAISQFPFWNQLRVTVLYTLTITVAVVIFSTAAGYAFARLRFFARPVLFGLVLSILMVPGEMLLISQYQIVQSLGWLNSLPGLVAPGLASAFGTFMMRQAFLNLPRELEEAARIDGAGPLTTFAVIMVPLVRPSMSALAVLSVISGWGAFLWPLVITTYADEMPLSVGLASFTTEFQTFYPQLMAASLLVMLPVMVFFIVFQRRVAEAMAFAGLKG